MTQLDVALAYLDRCQNEMLRLWETVVRLETPSAAPAAVDKLADAGIIDSPGRWKELNFTENSVRLLILKMAAALK